MNINTRAGALGALFCGLVLAGCGGQKTDNTAGSAAGGNAAGQTTGTTGNAGGKTYRIGMSQANKGEPWRQAMNTQIAAAAKKYPNVEVVFADAAQDNAKQIADIENFLQQGVNLLIVSPNEAAPLTDVVSKAFKGGTPVILLDRQINGNDYTMFIGADNRKIGRKAGEYVAGWCRKNKPDGCAVAEIRGLEGSTPAKERGDGFRDGLKSNPKAKIIASQNADWLREKAVPVSQAMLQANPNIDVIYGHNDPMAEAAIISAQNAGRKLDKMLFVGIDALPTPDGGIRSVQGGRLDATYVYPTGGQQAVDYAVKILSQKAKPPKKVVLQTEEVTSSNAAQVLKKYSG